MVQLWRCPAPNKTVPRVAYCGSVFFFMQLSCPNERNQKRRKVKTMAAKILRERDATDVMELAILMVMGLSGLLFLYAAGP